MKISIIIFTMLLIGCSSVSSKEDDIIDAECALKNSTESIHDKID